MVRHTGRASRRARWRRGTALIEFAMCVPIIGLILAVTFFFGWASMNQQHVKISDRYAAWRPVRGAGGVSGGELNRYFFNNSSDSVRVGYAIPESETPQYMVGEVGRISAEAQAFASRLVNERVPRGSYAAVSAHFPSEVGYWEQMTGRIRHDHVRDGQEWRRRQVEAEDFLRDQYLLPLDQALHAMGGTAHRFGETLSRLYNVRWRDRTGQ